jgi:Uma2 family endonuclease
MIAAVRPVRYTREEYRSFERASNMKHEFLDGVIYAMAGGSPEHAAIAGNVIFTLSAALRDRPCRVYSSDLRLHVLDTGLETYPDASVICGRVEVDPEDKHAATNPLLVVEVTSPSTEAYDRGEKLRHYQRITSLREAVLVSHRESLVEVFRKENDGSWTRHQAGPGRSLRLESIGCDLAVDEVYRDPTREPPAA